MTILMIKSSSDIEQGMRFLEKTDQDLAKIIDKEGPCRLKIDRKTPYDALLQAIAGQQLHANAANAILNRLKLANSGALPDPRALLKLRPDQLRECGFSFRKIDSLYALAMATLDGIVPSYEEALTLSDQDLIDRITVLPGIGCWTVEMLLIFTLGRMDIMPKDDFGIREGWRICKNLALQPKPKQLEIATRIWSPFRTIGAWYLWRAVEQSKPLNKRNPLTL